MNQLTLDFAGVRNQTTTLQELTANLTIDDLRNLTNHMIDTLLALIADCVDADVTFVPTDPAAFDRFAATPEEVKLSWTLGHVIVHATASAEESEFLAAELARGVEFHGRSRYEVPWMAVTTIEQCCHRLEESRHMQLATLNVWPEQPHLDLTYTMPYPGAQPMNAVGRFVMGLFHADSHLSQIKEIVQQAKAAQK